MVARLTPILTVTDPNGTTRDILGLAPDQYESLKFLLRRYYSWVDSGRDLDPWASGVSRAGILELTPIKRHKPTGGFDAGRSSPPEVNAHLWAIDAIVTALPVHQQLMLWWWLRDRKTHAWVAERLDMSLEKEKKAWKRVTTTLYYRLSGL